MEAMQAANLVFFLAILGMLATVTTLFSGVRLPRTFSVLLWPQGTLWF